MMHHRLRFTFYVLIGLLLIVAPTRAYNVDDVLIHLDMSRIVNDNGDYSILADQDEAALISGAFHMDDNGLYIEHGVTNIVTNPSIETNTTSWATTWGDTIAKSAEQAKIGLYSIKLTGSGAAGVGAYYPATVVSGTTYAVTAWFYVPTSWTGLDPQLRVVNTSWTDLATRQYITERDQWVKKVIVVTPLVTTIRVLAWGGSDPITTSFYIDGISIVKSNVATSYVDGYQGSGYTWNGNAHASASTRITTTLDLSDEIGAISENATWSVRLQYMAQYSSTANWPDEAILWDARGASDAARVTLEYEDSDDRYRVSINGSEILSSTAQTFVADAVQEIVLAQDYTGDVYVLYINGAANVTSTTELSAPAVNVFWLIGSDVYGANHANVAVDEYTVFDTALSASEAAAIYANGVTLLPDEETEGLDLLDGLVSYWTMDESSGPRYDSHGDNDLSDQNTVNYTASGKQGGAALWVPAQNETLYISGGDLINDSALTWGGWIRINTTMTESARILYESDDILLEFDQGSQRFAFMADDYGIVHPTAPVSGTWYYILGLYDPWSYRLGISVNGDSIDIPYADGLSDGTGTYFGEATEYDGYQDEIGLWSRMLTDEEIYALYNSGAGVSYGDLDDLGIQGGQGGQGSMDELVAYWPLEESSGTRYDVESSYHLTPSSTPGNDEGMVYYGVNLDGTDDYLSYPTDIISSSYTVAAWVLVNENCTTALDCPIIAAWDNMPEREFRLRYYGGYIHADVATVGGIGTKKIYLPATQSAWHFVGVSYDASIDVCTLRVDQTKTVEYQCILETDQTISFTIGTDAQLNGYLQGVVDEAMVLNYAITDAAWSTIYNGGFGMPYDLLDIEEDYIIYMPLVMRNWMPAIGPVDPCDDVVCDEGQHCLDGECVDDQEDIEAIVPIDYESASWQEWAAIIDELLAPVKKLIVEIEDSIKTAMQEACGNVDEEDTFVPSGDDLEFNEGQTTLEQVYNMGLALGKPVAYVRVLSSYDILGLNYLTLLIGYFTVMFLFIGFVLAYVILMRLIRGALDLIKWVYEWIPGKAT